jgi:hypothetical protein
MLRTDYSLGDQDWRRKGSTNRRIAEMQTEMDTVNQGA